VSTPVPVGVSSPISATGTLSRASGAITRTLDAARARAVPFTYYQIVRAGPVGLTGVAAMLVAIGLAMVTLISIQGRTDTLTQQIARVRQHPIAPPSAEDALSRVFSRLPTRDQIPGVIGQILEQARQAGVTLDSGHYAYSAQGAVARYELEFPLKAEYPSVRNFINRTLTAVPAAGLDRLHIERKVVGDSLVKADVRFVVFVRGGLEK
jgi:hypothetical protein